MKTMNKAVLLAAVTLVSTSIAATAETSPPMKLVELRDWTAVTATGAKGKICYALSKPQKQEPAGLNHGDVFLFVSTRPSEGIRNEPSVQVGYSFKEQSKVSVDIDGTKFSLFTRGDGAWVDAPADEAKLVDAMKRGRKLTIIGQSGRGNTTTYSFSLAGIGGALEAIGKECR